MELFFEILDSNREAFFLIVSFLSSILLIQVSVSIISFYSNIEKHAKRSIIKFIWKQGLASINETFHINLKEKNGKRIKWEVSVGEKSYLVTTWFTFIKNYEKAV
ncbi:hypothetical protein ACTWQB_17115 [Piscibacillus sp. B03]|uniref:hypothetical protein n=1 Tax=Piscibacillus sp. B03 TaxID=3457430 RepID=UPI003FCCC524